MPPRDPHHRDVDQIVFELHAATLQANLERQLLGRADAYDRARRVIARLLPDERLDHLQHDLAACLTGLAELVRAPRLGERHHRGDLGAQPAGRDQVGDRGQREPVGLDERR
jgi:hypothetical protein